jgi:hypothetical protein
MDALELIRREANTAWAWLEKVVRDVSAEQANWWPPGIANSIATTYLHVVVNADVEAGGALFGRQPLIERRWRGDVGQGRPYDAERFDDWPPRLSLLDWGLLRDYGRAVHAEIIESLDGLTPDHLTVPIDMTRSGLGMWTGLDILALHGWGHVKIHGGEIAVLKGLQGVLGYGEGMHSSTGPPCVP